MNRTFTAIVRHDATWWYGWIEEIPGVNCQETSKEDLLASLKSTLEEILALNREEAIRAAGSDYEELSIAL